MLLLPQSGTPLLPRPWLFTFFRARFFHFFQLPSAGLTHHPLSHKQPCSQLLQPIDEMEEVGVESPIGFSNRCSGQPKGADWKVSESWRLNNKPHLSVPIHSLKQREVLSTHFNIVFLFCRDSSLKRVVDVLKFINIPENVKVLLYRSDILSIF